MTVKNCSVIFFYFIFSYLGVDKQTGQSIQWIESDMTGIDIHPVCESIKAVIDLFVDAPAYFVRIFVLGLTFVPV